MPLSLGPCWLTLAALRVLDSVTGGLWRGGLHAGRLSVRLLAQCCPPCCDSLPLVPYAACMVHAHAQQTALPLAAVRASLAKALLSLPVGCSFGCGEASSQLYIGAEEVEGRSS